jgi:hypothetical protein
MPGTSACDDVIMTTLNGQDHVNERCAVQGVSLICRKRNVRCQANDDSSIIGRYK